MTTFEVARGAKGVKVGWLAVLGPHVPQIAASVDQELTAVVSASWHANLPRGVIFGRAPEVIFGSIGKISYLRLPHPPLGGPGWP